MVTKGYISAWANAKSVVDVLDVQDGRGYPSSIENASVVSYVYDSAVMAYDLENEYAGIESEGASALAKLRAGENVTRSDMEAVITFLDMHLHRGNYADRANVRVPAVLMMKDGSIEKSVLRLGDMLLLAQQHPETLRLTSLELADWSWQIYPIDGLYTGDGAALLWRPTADHEPTSITFPLSPTQLLVIGEDLPENIDMNRFLVRNCRRWIVGQRGSLPLDLIAEIAAKRAADSQ